MRKFREVDEDNLLALIEILTDNGCRLEIHRASRREDCYYNLYDVFILGNTGEKKDD